MLEILSFLSSLLFISHIIGVCIVLICKHQELLQDDLLTIAMGEIEETIKAHVASFTVI